MAEPSPAVRPLFWEWWALESLAAAERDSCSISRIWPPPFSLGYSSGSTGRRKVPAVGGRLGHNFRPPVFPPPLPVLSPGHFSPPSTSALSSFSLRLPFVSSPFPVLCLPHPLFCPPFSPPLACPNSGPRSCSLDCWRCPPVCPPSRRGP